MFLLHGFGVNAFAGGFPFDEFVYASKFKLLHMVAYDATTTILPRSQRCFWLQVPSHGSENPWFRVGRIFRFRVAKKYRYKYQCLFFITIINSKSSSNHLWKRNTDIYFQMLKFNAVKYKNRTLPFTIVKDSLPVKTENGRFKLPSEDVVLVKVHSAALNPIDIFVKNSLLPWIFKGDKGFGNDYSGEVAAIGVRAAKKTGFSVGDRIAGLYQVILGPGSTSEYILISPFKGDGANARKLPDNLSYQQGASYPLVLGTAQTMFDTVEKGNSHKNVLILGAGTAVGRYCVQLALKVYGSENVVVTCSGRTEETIKDLGATAVIDYTKHNSLLNPVIELVKETGKFDVILDCCGNSDLFPQITTILKNRKEFGSYVTIVGDNKANFQSGNILGMVLDNSRAVLRTAKKKFGVLPYFYTQTMLDVNGPWPDKCAKNLADGKLKMFIDSEYHMSDIQKAVDRLQTNKASGKVIVNMV